MNFNIITYLACICFFFLFGRLFIVPIKKILKLVLNSIIGGVVIFLINLVGANFGFHIGLNFFTSVLVGLLGLPGVVVLVIIKLLLGGKLTLCKTCVIIFAMEKSRNILKGVWYKC